MVSSSLSSSPPSLRAHLLDHLHLRADASRLCPQVRGLRSPWVIFYTVLASTVVVGIWVFQLLNVGDGGESVMQDAMRPVLILRVMRLLRVVCALRLLRHFKTFFTLAGALWMSRDAVGATFVLVALAQNVAACFALEVSNLT